MFRRCQVHFLLASPYLSCVAPRPPCYHSCQLAAAKHEISRDEAQTFKASKSRPRPPHHLALALKGQLLHPHPLTLLTQVGQEVVIAPHGGAITQAPPLRTCSMYTNLCAPVGTFGC